MRLPSRERAAVSTPRVPVAVLVAVAGLMIAADLTAASTPRVSAAPPAPAAAAFTGDATPDSIVVRGVLVLRLPDSYRTRLLPRDPALASIVGGAWRPPRAGESVPIRGLPADSAAVWTAVAADSAGWFRGPALESGWAYASVTVPRRGAWILAGSNHEYAYVNGEPRAGNKYATKDTYESWEPRYDYSLLPVMLHAGRNDLLFRCERGGLKAVLRLPRSPVMLNPRDVTAPDIIVAAQPVDAWIALPVINATEQPLAGLVLEVASGDSVSGRAALPRIAPMTICKVPVHLAGRKPMTPTPSQMPLIARLLSGVDPGPRALDERTITLRLVRPDELRKITFVSGVDGSVQYYAELPAKRTSGWFPEGPDGVVLTLHGANVEASNQAASYAPKPWARIVAPTNRRPYGYSWEDWGRLDALEVFDLAAPPDASQQRPTVWLTGHSMGGHGTWLLGSTYPDRFAAIGPSAGWATFWTYRFEYDRSKLTPLERMLTRASNASETLQLEPNLEPLGVYCLHGGADDNVPPAQSHMLVDELKKFHPDWVYHEEPGQGHWWDLSSEPGTDCVDWAPMFEFFARRARLRDDAALEVDFRTASPGVSSTCRWVTVLAQERPCEMSRVHVRCLPGARRIIGETENVRELRLRPDPLGPGEDMTLELDGQILPADPHGSWAEGAPLATLQRRNGIWTRAPAGVAEIGHGSRADRKTPARYGPFKDAFRHRFQFVIGTRGTPEEKAWAAAKARFDAETWWYQGNGTVDIVRDVDFDPKAEPDRGVILYGNARTNAAWSALLPDCPVRIERGAATIGKRRLKGDDLACLFVRPRPGSEVACVAVVSGTGLAGMRLTDVLPYLQAGFSLPDCCVLSPEILTSGDRGIRTAGFFGMDWSVEGGEFLWNE